GERVVALVHRRVAFEGGLLELPPGLLALAQRGVALAGELLDLLVLLAGDLLETSLAAKRLLGDLRGGRRLAGLGGVTRAGGFGELLPEAVALADGFVALAPRGGQLGPGHRQLVLQPGVLRQQLVAIRLKRRGGLAELGGLLLEPARAQALALVALGHRRLLARTCGRLGRELDHHARRHRQLDLTRVGRVALPRERGRPVAALLGRPRLVLEHGKQVALAV